PAAGAAWGAALIDEVGDDPVERHAVEEAVPGQHHEVVDGLGRLLGVEVEGHHADVGGNSGDIGLVDVDAHRRFLGERRGAGRRFVRLRTGGVAREGRAGGYVHRGRGGGRRGRRSRHGGGRRRR